jgi:hypothetical protein
VTFPDADTTPLAVTAALLHEATRSVDFIQVGSPRAPWDKLSSQQKDIAVQHVLTSLNRSFEEYYEVVTQAYRQIGRDVADPSDESDELVRFARMRHSIIRCLLPQDHEGVSR